MKLQDSSPKPSLKGRSEEALRDKATGWSEVWRLDPISPILPDPSVFPPIWRSEAGAEIETEAEAGNRQNFLSC